MKVIKEMDKKDKWYKDSSLWAGVGLVVVSLWVIFNRK
jgi:hypothetical protein